MKSAFSKTHSIAKKNRKERGNYSIGLYKVFNKVKVISSCVLQDKVGVLLFVWIVKKGRGNY